MFKLVTERVVKRDVTILFPKEGTGFQKASTQVEWVFHTEEELKKITEEAEKADGERLGITFWAKVTRGWSGYVDEDEQVLDFNAANLKRVLARAEVSIAWTRAYFEAQIPVERKGN
jgi:hypothetical protein